MPKVDVYDVNGQVVGEADLLDDVFGAPVNHALMHQAVRVYLANRRAGTVSTKTRGEVRGGGRKPWRQKGSGAGQAREYPVAPLAGRWRGLRAQAPGLAAADAQEGQKAGAPECSFGQAAGRRAAGGGPAGAA